MRIVALLKRICLQMFRDKRTLALLFIAPLVILTLMHILFTSDTSKLKLGVTHLDGNLVQFLKKSDMTLKVYPDANSHSITNDDLDGLLQMNHGKMELTLQNSDPTRAKSLLMEVTQILTIPASHDEMRFTDINYIYGNKNTGFFDVLSPVFVGYFVFFFVFLISGIGLLKERTTGTLEKLLSTPIRRAEIVFAYLIGYGLFAVLQTVIVVTYSIKVLDVVLAGSIWNVLLINLLVALVALSLGTLLSTFAASEFQMLQFIPLVVVPQIFFSGIIPVEGMANWLQVLARIMPIYYASDALKNVMYKGFTLFQVYDDVLNLLSFAILFVILNILTLKKYRKL